MLARQLALAKGIEISLHVDPSLPEIEHDSDQIHQVLLNLLLNALQAIDRHGKELSRRDSNAVIEATGNGRGIPAEHLPNISRPFYTMKGDGTGLGLSPRSPHRRRSPGPHQRDQHRWQKHDLRRDPSSAAAARQVV